MTALESVRSTPWHQPPQEAPEAAPTVPDGPVTARSLSDGGGVNPSTVLMAAMDGLDGVEDVVVVGLRVRPLQPVAPWSRLEGVGEDGGKGHHRGEIISDADG